jgi:hypothetical protein
MKTPAPFLVVVAILLTAQAGIAVADDTRTLAGEFVWNQQDRGGDLEAVFTSTGEGQWDVAFHFKFRGRPHVYSGTAEGSLSEGELRGKVLNENRNRTFTFSGTFEDGTFRGTHNEIAGDREQSTGTLTLSK